MRQRSLADRLLSLQLILVSAAIVLIAVSTFLLTDRLLVHEEGKALAEAAARAAAGIAGEWKEEKDLARAARSAVEESPLLGYGIDVYDQDRHLVFTTSRQSRSTKRSGTRQYEVPLPEGGWVVARVSTEPRRGAIAALLAVLTAVSLTVFALTFAASRILARRELAPLARLAGEADQLARDMRIRPLHRDGDPVEVGAVATAFDRLLARLDEFLESERNFTRDAAHELRTPLTVISGELEYTLADSSLPGPHRAHLETARSHARALSDLVDALLFLRSAEGGTAGRERAVDPVNLGDVARDLIGAIRSENPSRAADLDVRLPDEALVAGDVELLAAAVRNLIENAIKFTSDGLPVRVTAAADAEWVRLAVEDGGPGIPAAEAERVFDPFYRGAEARATRSGLGLGLSLARRVARAHGGELRLDRSELGGALLELRLPALARGSGRGRAFSV
jgi:two-component system, OmpR family, sensor kinase